MHHLCHTPALISGHRPLITLMSDDCVRPLITPLIIMMRQATLITPLIITSSAGCWPGPGGQGEGGVAGARRRGRGLWQGGRCSRSRPGCFPPHKSKTRSQQASPGTRVCQSLQGIPQKWDTFFGGL